jgi:uncharacterized membrane protein YcaP (DUF421 family)
MDIVIRAAVVFFLLLLVTRVVGRRELSTLEPFDLILLVVMGDLIQQGVTQMDTSITGAALAVGTIALLTIAVSWLNYRFRPLRRVLEGEPVILISDGELIERNLARERLTLGELEHAAREQQMGSLDDVAYAVLETSGRISIIPKAGVAT